MKSVQAFLKELEEDDEELVKLKAANAEEIVDESEDTAASISNGLR